MTEAILYLLAAFLSLWVMIVVVVNPKEKVTMDLDAMTRICEGFDIQTTNDGFTCTIKSAS